MPTKPTAKLDARTLKRLLSYLRPYRGKFIAVLFCILLTALTSVASSLFLQVLIDDYIAPLLLEASPVFTGLLKIILLMAGIYLIGVVSSLLYNRLMAVISQGILKTIRDDMFEHMQALPIRYFDTHTHGDVMSYYTNDTDTLRQMLSQSIPQIFSSIITILSVFCAMVSVSIWLTLFVLAFVFLMLKVTRKIAGKSGHYFIRQQQALGDVNGYIEEMINGQKVIKVFCHEEETIEEFQRRNENLCRDATAANTFANILMPIMGNLGNLQYVLVAIVGGAMAISGVGGLTLGAIASFLQLSKSFTQPISQVSQQLNSIVMALAGAQRIFTLLDEEPEADEGYVTLVNAACIDGALRETAGHTGLWAWKHPHQDGSVTYTELRGEVRFYDVDFGYDSDKIVLHNISLYAEPGQKAGSLSAPPEPARLRSPT